MSKRMEFRCERSIYRNKIDILLIDHSDSRRVGVAKSVVFEVVDEGALIEDPTLSVHPDVAQGLMDELWRVGLRPSEGTGSAGSLAATQSHLKDMRSIAYALMRKEGMEV